MPEEVEAKNVEIKAEEVKTKAEPIKLETETAQEEAVVIQPDKDAPFEKHVYDCPSCHKKIKVHFGDCGCKDYSPNILSWVMKQLP